jgi:hypothetical protein
VITTNVPWREKLPPIESHWVTEKSLLKAPWKGVVHHFSGTSRLDVGGSWCTIQGMSRNKATGINRSLRVHSKNLDLTLGIMETH